MSRLSEAVDVLYGDDPDEFTARRKELASQARAAGDKAAAKEIAALSKPTRSAWLVNRLVRNDPSVPGRLSELGDQLRAGEASLDGPAIRKLSIARRGLVDSLVRQAIAESAVSAALRDEVTETLNAALADPGVAAQIAAGTLVRAAHWAGFGPGIGTAQGSDLTAALGASLGAAPSAKAAPPTKATKATTGPAQRRQQAEQASADAALAVQTAAATERAKQHKVRDLESQIADHRNQVAINEQSVLKAQRELALAQRNLADTQLRLAKAQEGLATARDDLKQASAQARQAVAAQRKAQQALDRLRP